jgi:DNA-binding transcriptional LysR family regulator
MVLFSQLVKIGGISRAAAQLGLPKSTISRRIGKLEDQVGLRLLERNTRTMRLTEVGEAFLQHCNNIAEELNLATKVADGLSHGPNGLLRVSASYSVGRQLLGPVIASFVQQWPNVRVRLVLSNRRVDLIDEGFDLAIRVGPLSESSLIVRRLGGTKISFFTSPQYLRTLKHPLRTPADLDGLCIMQMSEFDPPLSTTIVGPDGPRAFALKARGMMNDFHLLKDIVVSGAGIAVLPNYLCCEEVAAGRLVTVLPEWSLPEVDFHAIYPSRQGVTPKLSSFLAILTEHLATALPGRSAGASPKSICDDHHTLPFAGFMQPALPAMALTPP